MVYVSMHMCLGVEATEQCLPFRSITLPIIVRQGLSSVLELGLWPGSSRDSPNFPVSPLMLEVQAGMPDNLHECCQSTLRP